MGDLQRLSVTLEANKEQLPQLEHFRLKLGGIVTQSLEVSKQQAALKATKQESSKQLRRLLTEGQRVANVVRTAVKDHFGPREEKVAEFGLQPFRGRKVKAATPTPAPTPAKPTPIIPPAPAGPGTPAK
jgi:regulator of replication initiation timing